MDAALLKRAFDLLGSNQRARCVVYGDVFRVAINATQAGPNGILPTFAPWNNRADFFESCAGNNFSDLIVTLFTRHDYDFEERGRALERADCVSDDWFARDKGKQFIKP